MTMPHPLLLICHAHYRYCIQPDNSQLLRGPLVQTIQLAARWHREISNLPGTVAAPPSGTLFSYTNHYPRAGTTQWSAPLGRPQDGQTPSITVATGVPGTSTMNGTGPFSLENSGALDVIEPWWKVEARCCCRVYRFVGFIGSCNLCRKGQNFRTCTAFSFNRFRNRHGGTWPPRRHNCRTTHTAPVPPWATSLSRYVIG